MAITTGSLAEALDIQGKYSSFNSFITSFGGTITQLSTTPMQGSLLQANDINNLNDKVTEFKQETYLSTQSQWWVGVTVAHGDLISPTQFENLNTTIGNFSKVKCRNDAYHSYGSNNHGQNADGNNNNTTCTANIANSDGTNSHSACTTRTVKTHGTNSNVAKSNTAKSNVAKSNVAKSNTTKSNVAKSNVAKSHGTNNHEAQWAGYCTNTSCSPYWTWGQWTRHHQTCHWGAYTAHTTKTNTNNSHQNNSHQNNSHQNNSHQNHSHQNHSHQNNSHTTQSNTYNSDGTHSHTTCSSRTYKSNSTNSHQACTAHGNCTAKGTCKHTTYIDITNAYKNQ